MGCFTPAELISPFSSCPKLAQVSHGCGIWQPLVTQIQQNTKSLLHTKMSETQGGWGAGTRGITWKEQWQWSLLQTNRCVGGGWRDTAIPRNTQHFTLAIRQKHHQIVFVTGRWRKPKIHMAVGFDQFTLTANTHYINRLISSKYLETVWLLTKPFPAEFLKKRTPWHIAYIVSITTNTDHIQVFWNKCCFFQEKGIWYKTFLRKSRQPQQKLTASIKICLHVSSTFSCKKYKQVSLYSDRYNPLKLSRDYALS